MPIKKLRNTEHLQKPLASISHSYCIHTDEGMDGEAVCLAFATTTGPDCLRDVIKQYGIRLKVYRTIKDVLAASEQVFLDVPNFRKMSLTL